MFLFYGAAFGTKEETYQSVFDAQSKNYSLGVQKRVVKISEHAPLVRFYHHVGRLFETTFEVVDENGKTIAILTEEKLKTLAAHNKLSRSYAAIMPGKNERTTTKAVDFSKKYFLKSKRVGKLPHLTKSR